jgi:hypothetical protein
LKNKEVWLFIFLFGLLFFNWPLMDIFAAVLPYYLYFIWLLFILGIGCVATLGSRAEKKDHV